jgi:hypothetical protein
MKHSQHAPDRGLSSPARINCSLDRNSSRCVFISAKGPGMYRGHISREHSTSWDVRAWVACGETSKPALHRRAVFGRHAGVRRDCSGPVKNRVTRPWVRACSRTMTLHFFVCNGPWLLQSGVRPVEPESLGGTHIRLTVQQRCRHESSPSCFEGSAG